MRPFGTVRNGFTLVELLIATSMLAMLVAGGLAVLSTGSRAAGKAKRYDAMVGHGQAALEMMAADIRAAATQGKHRMVSLDSQYGGMDADTLDFIVAGPPRLPQSDGPPGGLCEVGYYIENDPETEARGLLRREDSTLDDDPLGGGAASVVGACVSELDLEFYDGLTWESGWSDKDHFPKAVRIRIVVVDEDEIENPQTFSTTVPVFAE